MTINPARILGIPKGTLAIGADADVTIIDPNARWTVDPDRFHSKSATRPSPAGNFAAEPKPSSSAAR